MSEHPKYGHLPRCPKDANKLCDYLSIQLDLGKAREENEQLRHDLKVAEIFINNEGKKLDAIRKKCEDEQSSGYLTRSYKFAEEILEVLGE